MKLSLMNTILLMQLGGLKLATQQKWSKQVGLESESKSSQGGYASRVSRKEAEEELQEQDLKHKPAINKVKEIIDLRS
jgi:hypothetical protein